MVSEVCLVDFGRISKECLVGFWMLSEGCLVDQNVHVLKRMVRLSQESTGGERKS